MCCDVLLGPDFQQHFSITIVYGKHKPGLKFSIAENNSVCSLVAANFAESILFANVQNNAKPVATKSRKFSPYDHDFTDQEVQRERESYN